MSLLLLTGMDSDGTINGHAGGCRGCDTPTTSLPSAISAIFSNHLVESTMIPCHSVNSAIRLYDSIRSTVVCAQWRPDRG